MRSQSDETVPPPGGGEPTIVIRGRFDVSGRTVTELRRLARERADEFADGLPYEVEIDADRVELGTGELLSWAGHCRVLVETS